jgi:hypothetical protein
MCETLWGLGKTKKFKFSDIIQVKIAREFTGMERSNDLYLVFRDGEKRYGFYSEYKGIENIGIRIAKTIGVECVHIEPTFCTWNGNTVIYIK